MIMASVTPSKSTGEFIAKRVVAFMREVGCEQSDITVKSDQEPAVQAIITEIGRVRAARGGGRMAVEASPKGSSASNGVIERGVQTVEHQMKVMRSALEERLGVTIPVKSAVWPWLAEYSTFLLNRLEVGHDGKTPYELAKGKRARVLGFEFGEAVMWRRKPVNGRLGKLECM